jgi:hypothetical protein
MPSFSRAKHCSNSAADRYRAQRDTALQAVSHQHQHRRGLNLNTNRSAAGSRAMTASSSGSSRTQPGSKAAFLARLSHNTITAALLPQRLRKLSSALLPANVSAERRLVEAANLAILTAASSFASRCNASACCLARCSASWARAVAASFSALTRARRSSARRLAASGSILAVVAP